MVIGGSLPSRSKIPSTSLVTVRKEGSRDPCDRRPSADEFRSPGEGLPGGHVYAAKDVALAGASLFRRTDDPLYHITHIDDVHAAVNVKKGRSFLDVRQQRAAVEVDVTLPDDDGGIDDDRVESFL